MNKITKLSCLALAIVGFTTTAIAAPVTYTFKTVGSKNNGTLSFDTASISLNQNASIPVSLTNFNYQAFFSSPLPPTLNFGIDNITSAFLNIGPNGALNSITLNGVVSFANYVDVPMTFFGDPLTNSSELSLAGTSNLTGLPLMGTFVGPKHLATDVPEPSELGIYGLGLALIAGLLAFGIKKDRNLAQLA
jgi:hypothetical protein